MTYFTVIPHKYCAVSRIYCRRTEIAFFETHVVWKPLRVVEGGEQKNFTMMAQE